MKKLAQIPSISTLSSIDDPNLKRFLSAIKERVEGLEKPVSQVGENNKRPSVQDMIDAGIIGAENIE